MVFQPPFANRPPWFQLLFFLIIIVGSLFFVTMLGSLLAAVIFGPGVLENLGAMNDLESPDNIAQLKYFQIVSQMGLFIVPCIAYLLLRTREKAAYVFLKGKLPLAHFFAGAALMLLALPLINILLEWNMQLQLPGFLSGLEKWMKASEDQAARVTEAFLITDSPLDFMVNILMIAVIPAIGEELLFRGVLLRILKDWSKNMHVAIILSATMFSFIHFQFYGFVPRFLMGVAFGYMLYWSGSLWVPMIAHFVNNATAVIVAWVGASYYPDLDFNTFGSSQNIFIIIGSVVMTTLLLFFLWINRKREKPLMVYEPKPGAESDAPEA